MPNSGLGELVGMMTTGIILVLLGSAAFAFGRLIGESWRRSRTSPPRIDAPRNIPRPVGPGPLWQNSRIWEDHHLRGQHQPMAGYRIGPYPEIPTEGSLTEDQEDLEDSMVWRIEGGQQRRL